MGPAELGRAVTVENMVCAPGPEGDDQAGCGTDVSGYTLFQDRAGADGVGDGAVHVQCDEPGCRVSPGTFLTGAMTLKTTADCGEEVS